VRVCVCARVGTCVELLLSVGLHLLNCVIDRINRVLCITYIYFSLFTDIDDLTLNVFISLVRTVNIIFFLSVLYSARNIYIISRQLISFQILVIVCEEE